MLIHYLKIAFRNHSKHKVQSAISVLSLAIAFASVSLAAYWVHYEQTYDSFLPDYDRIYKVANKRSGETYPDDMTKLPLPTHLMENYPEVDKACGIKTEWHDNTLVKINNHFFSSGCKKITPETVDILGIQWLEGNKDLESWTENEVAISEQIARKVCGKDSPIGMKLKLETGEKSVESDSVVYQIVAVFQAQSKHSNFNFDILQKLFPPASPWEMVSCETYVRLHLKTDPELFLKKLKTDSIESAYNIYDTYNVLTPLKEVHYTYPKQKRNIRLNDMKLFAGASILLAVCALVNYLTLFVSRLRTRGRDMALRAICGSSSWQLGLLLMVEYLLLLGSSLFFSILFVELAYGRFIELAQLEINRSAIYVGCGYLLLFILGLATVLSLIPILYFKRKTLRVQMESAPIQLGRNRFRIAGVSVQLFISMFFIFCATVMIKQVHFLIHSDINIERKNIASLMVANMKADQIMNILR